MTRVPVLVAVLFSLAACAEHNPIEWGKSAARDVGNLFGSDTPPEAEPPAAEGRPYPNLATVPRRPRDTPEAKAQREADLARLTRDREKALADDQVLRDTGAMPPPEVPKEEAAAPAPAPSGTSPTVPTPSAAVAVAPAPPAPASPVPAPATVPTPAAAPAAAAVLRVGSVGFGRDAATLTPGAQRSLADAAARARANNGRVRLVPAQTARQAAAPDIARARLAAITQALAAAGIPAARVTVEEALGQRVDLYDVYVER